MSYANSTRRFMAIPLLAFDWVRQTSLSNPRQMNYVVMWTSLVVIMTVGNGADKLTTSGGVATQYEKFRRANRYFMPYFIADYKFKFPQVKQ